MAFMVWQLEALTRYNPVLMIFEDAHWTDPTSLELFSRAVDRIQTLRALLIVTFRPEVDPRTRSANRTPRSRRGERASDAPSRFINASRSMGPCRRSVFTRRVLSREHPSRSRQDWRGARLAADDKRRGEGPLRKS